MNLNGDRGLQAVTRIFTRGSQNMIKANIKRKIMTMKNWNRVQGADVLDQGTSTIDETMNVEKSTTKGIVRVRTVRIVLTRAVKTTVIAA